jgi:hypothetical protein
MIQEALLYKRAHAGDTRVGGPERAFGLKEEKIKKEETDDDDKKKKINQSLTRVATYFKIYAPKRNPFNAREPVEFNDIATHFKETYKTQLIQQDTKTFIDNLLKIPPVGLVYNTLDTLDDTPNIFAQLTENGRTIRKTNIKRTYTYLTDAEAEELVSQQIPDPRTPSPTPVREAGRRGSRGSLRIQIPPGPTGFA